MTAVPSPNADPNQDDPELTTSLSSSPVTTGSASQERDKLVLGDTYRLEKRLGRGGMGEVWLATHLLLDQPRAIKLMLEEYSADPHNRERFVRGEASSSLKLQHPNIVRVYELGQSQDLLYIVMEYVEGNEFGPDLKAFLKAKGPLELEQAGRFLEQLAAALDSAHALGIIHRDLKPANVLMTPQGQLKLSDFGLVKDLTAQDVELTSQGHTVGTPLYMAPEQARGEVSAASDIYGLGVMLYEMVTGQLPFKGITTQSLLVQHATATPVAPDQLNPAIPGPVSAVILRTLAKQPADRYPSAQSFAIAYWHALGREPLNTQTTPISLTTPLPNPPVTVHNLPEAPNALLGRQRELDEICGLLRADKPRLLTLTGPGGTGKTRLSLEVARSLLNDFPAGVYFIALETITQREMLLGALAQSLQIKEEPNQTLLQTLQNYLQPRQLLLVLDNFEQAIHCGPVLADLLRAAPHLKLLVTSRVALHLSLEKEYRLEPLALPGPDQKPSQSLTTWRQSPAVTLFVERAQAARASFNLTVENAEAVAQICRRLDGLPLAIELAAARLKVLTPAQILARLTNSLKLLTGGATDLPSRQQTLRNAIEWSYELLDEDEKKLFRRLAVFVGGSTLESAEQVCNTKGDLAIDILEGLESLVNKSLLTQRETAGGEIRLGMLQTIREYALEKLSETGELAETERGLAAYYLEFARVIQDEITPGQTPPAVIQAKIEAELVNLRRVMQIFQEAADWSPLCKVFIVVWYFWYRKNYLSETEEWLKLLLEKSEQLEPALYVKILRFQGAIFWIRGDLEKVQKLDELSLQKYQELNDKKGFVQTLVNMSINSNSRADYAKSVSLCEEALVIARQLENQNTDELLADILNSLGVALFNQSQYDRAEQALRQSLTLDMQRTDNFGAAGTLLNLGNLALVQLQYEQAQDLYNQSLHLFEELGNKRGIAMAQRNLATAAQDQGQYELAEKLCRQSLALRWEYQDKVGIASSLEGLAQARLGLAQSFQAIQMYAVANQLRQSIKSARPQREQKKYEANIIKLTELLGPEQFETDWNSASQLPLEQFVQEWF